MKFLTLNQLMLIGMGIFVFGVLLILLIGINQKDNLIEDVGSVNSLEDVEKFIVECKQKLFLDCDELLLRELKKIDKEKQ